MNRLTGRIHFVALNHCRWNMSFSSFSHLLISIASVALVSLKLQLSRIPVITGLVLLWQQLHYFTKKQSSKCNDTAGQIINIFGAWLSFAIVAEVGCCVGHSGLWDSGQFQASFYSPKTLNQKFDLPLILTNCQKDVCWSIFQNQCDIWNFAPVQIWLLFAYCILCLG